MDKIIPYDLEKSQSIRIMAVFGVHDFLKVDELYICSPGEFEDDTTNQQV